MSSRTENNSTKTTRIVIIGGGITGLAAAHRLIELQRQAECQLDVILREAGPRLGGVLKTTRRDGFLIEGGADSFISEKPEAIDLARRLGLQSRLIETNEQHRRSFIVRRGRLVPVPEGFIDGAGAHLAASHQRYLQLGRQSTNGPRVVHSRRTIQNGADDESGPIRPSAAGAWL
jgi:protoporphyrinogen oxidase